MADAESPWAKPSPSLRRMSSGSSITKTPPISPSKSSMTPLSLSGGSPRSTGKEGSVKSPARSLRRARTFSSDMTPKSERSWVHRGAILEAPDLSALSETQRSFRKQRFNREELTCFKRLPAPSQLCAWKAEVYWQCTGQVRSESCARSCHTLPLGKGRFYTTSRNGLSLPELHQVDVKSLTSPPEKFKQEEVQPLPEETPTAMVLEKIFPRNPLKPTSDESDGSQRNARLRGSFARISIKKPDIQLQQPQLQRTGSRTASSYGNRDRPRTASPETAQRSASRSRPRTGDKSKANPLPTRIESDSKVVAFRKMILDKFPTMTKAFDAFIMDTTQGQRELTRWEFSRFLTRHLGGLSREEHIKIFEFLDTDKSGTISMQEFHTAVEAAAPVKTMEDFRRKLVALGWTSMRQALHAMEAGRTGTRRLSLHEFGAALTKAGVNDDDEHINVFNAILDPHSESGTVSINELSSAISAVSPSLLLEDIRGRLLSKYDNLQQAYYGIDINLTDSLDLHEFVRAATNHWKMSLHEGYKAFTLVDANKKRWIGRPDFETALRMVEPSLNYEEIRWKVRQRFRSILETLQREAIRVAAGIESDPVENADGTGSELAGSAGDDYFGSAGTAQKVLQAFQSAGIDEGRRYRTAGQWHKLLEPLQLSEADTKALCDLMDINKDGFLSAQEFERGLRIFAPSVILEDLRCSCLRNHCRVADAFAAVPQEQRYVPLDAAGMTKVLEQLDLHHGIQVQAILDLIEPSRDGGLTVSELVAALQCSSPGVQVRLPTAQRNAQAREKVHSTMAPFHKSATELRAHVRLKPPSEGDELIVMGSFDEIRAQSPSSTRAARPIEGPNATAANSRSVSTPPQNVKQSWGKVRKCLEQTTDHTPILERVRGYYSNAGERTANDEKLLARSHSRFNHFKKSTGHYEVLTRPLM